MDRRRKTLSAAALFALALSAALMVNCGQPGSPATPLLRRADRHIEAAMGEIKGLDGFNGEVVALLSGDRPPGTVEKLEQVLARARARARSALDQLDSAAGELRKAAGLKVSANMKEYLGLKSRAVDEQRRSLRATVAAMDLRIETADEVVAGVPLDQAMLEKIAEMSSLEKEAEESAKSSAELHEKANDYYEKNKPGR